MRILLVEDDAMIGAEVQGGLRDASYAVDWVRTGQMALEALAAHRYDLMLLDLGLPELDGSDVLRTIRARHDELPTIVITARDAVEDRIRGLDDGADDYVVKPFDLSEVLARIRAVSRRKGGVGSPLLTSGRLTLDPVTRQASAVGKPAVTLSNREYALLQVLMVRPGAILSRSELEGRIYGWGEEVESNAIEFLIHALRRKLGADAIRNVRGVGWMVSKSG